MSPFFQLEEYAKATNLDEACHTLCRTRKAFVSAYAQSSAEQVSVHGRAVICCGYSSGRLRLVPVCASPIQRPFSGQRHYWQKGSYREFQSYPSGLTGTIEISGTIQPVLWGTLPRTVTDGEPFFHCEIDPTLFSGSLSRKRGCSSPTMKGFTTPL